jgi:hypothetical protein
MQKKRPSSSLLFVVACHIKQAGYPAVQRNRFKCSRDSMNLAAPEEITEDIKEKLLSKCLTGCIKIYIV